MSDHRMETRCRQNTGAARVVVTGLGTISPLGCSLEGTWRGLVDGQSGVGPISAFDASGLTTRIAASVRDFDPGRFMDPKEARRLSPFIQYALAASAEAIGQAGLDMNKAWGECAGVEIGSALGGASLVEEQRMVLEKKGPRYTNPAVIPSILINSAACAVAIRYGIRGPLSAPVAACATGTVAIGEAARRVAFGEVDIMIAGGTDSVMTPLAIVGFGRLGALSTKNDTPQRACAPFSADRDGTVIGEGAAVMVLESLAHAQARGARILAEVAGYGLTADAVHLVAPDPEGIGAARAMARALHTADVRPEQLGWICAHGTGTQLNDAAETRAMRRALGEHAYAVPATSLKGALGHMLGAAGAISAVAAVQVLQTGVMPPTINYAVADPDCDLDYVPNTARSGRVDVAMVNAFGFGGQNASLVLKAWRD